MIVQAKNSLVGRPLSSGQLLFVSGSGEGFQCRRRSRTDVPVFLFGTSAWVEGIGERLAAIDLPERWYVVLTPPVGVPTGAVFAAPELTRDTEPLKMADFSAQQQDRFKNDLEAVVIARFPEVRASLEWLRRHGKARMTGSGSCVFAGFDTREGAQRVLDQLPAPMTGFVAKGLTHHPLRAQ